MAQAVIPKSPSRPAIGGWQGRVKMFGGLPVALTASGRTATLGGLRALGLPAGATVLMPAWHCGSEVDAVLAAGGRPVLYRLERDMQADLDHLSKLMTTHAPWAIYVTHYFGHAQSVRRIRALCERHGARLIEDLALGLLSQDRSGAPLGGVGDMTVFSLVKTLCVPDGGALWLRDPSLRRAFPAPGIMRDLRSLARQFKRRRHRTGPLKDRFAGTPMAALDRWNDSAGIDPASPLQAATRPTRALLSVMDCATILAAHRRSYAALWEAFSEHPTARPVLPPLPDGACPAYFPLWVEDPDRASAALARAGVESVRFWRRFHPWVDLSCHPEIRSLKRRTLRLPVHPGVDAEAIRRITDALRPAILTRP